MMKNIKSETIFTWWASGEVWNRKQEKEKGHFFIRKHYNKSRIVVGYRNKVSSKLSFYTILLTMTRSQAGSLSISFNEQPSFPGLLSSLLSRLVRWKVVRLVFNQIASLRYFDRDFTKYYYLISYRVFWPQKRVCGIVINMYLNMNNIQWMDKWMELALWFVDDVLLNVHHHHIIRSTFIAWYITAHTIQDLKWESVIVFGSKSWKIYHSRMVLALGCWMHHLCF